MSDSPSTDDRATNEAVEPAVQMSGGSEISLFSLAVAFLRIGSVAFGGFMMMVSMVEREFVDRRKSIGSGEMLEMISLVSLLPGPMAVNIVAWTGYRLRGAAGAFVAMSSVIAPGFFLIWGLGLAYLEFAKLPTTRQVFDGMLAALAAVIVDVAIRMARKNAPNLARRFVVFAVIAIMIAVPARHEFLALIVALVACGSIGQMLVTAKVRPTTGLTTAPKASPSARANLAWMAVTVFGLLVFSGGTWFLMTGNGWLRIFGVLSGLSLLLFGGAYVFIPLMQGMLVGDLGWLANRDFLDAVAMGQVLPGPNLISLAFIGGQLAGFPGMLAATIGIFMPSAILTIQASKILDTLKESPIISGVMAGLQVGVVGAIAASAWTILEASWKTENMESPVNGVGNAMVSSFVVFALALSLLVKYRIPLYLLLPLAGLAGWTISLIHGS